MRTVKEIFDTLPYEIRTLQFDRHRKSVELEKTIDHYFKIAEKLTSQDRIKAYDRILYECSTAMFQIESEYGCDDERLLQIYEDVDDYCIKNSDRILDVVKKRGYVSLYDSYGRYSKNGTYDDIKKIPIMELMMDDLFQDAMAEDIYKMWKIDYLKKHYPDIAPAYEVIINAIYRLDIESDSANFEYDFLVRAGVYSEESIDELNVISDFIDCKDEKIVELLSTRISSYTEGKPIAITLIAIIKLGYINIDKITRCKLYGSIRQINNSTFRDSSVNNYVNQFTSKSLDDPTQSAIEIEVETIKKLLV